jgi:hypothetical protein
MTVALGLLGYLFATVYAGWGWGLGFLLGALWGAGNLYLIKTLIERVVRLGERDGMSIAVLMAVKFPLLYFIGYLILSRDWYPFLAPVLGFSLSLGVIVLKAGGRMLLRLDDTRAHRQAATGLKN